MGRNEKIQQLIVLGLLGVFALVLVNGLRASGLLGRRTPTAVAPIAAPAVSERQAAVDPASAPVSDGASSAETVPAATTYDAAGRNPLRPAFRPEPATPEPPRTDVIKTVQPPTRTVPDPLAANEAVPAHLEGILWSDMRSRAILDGEVYGVGDALGPAQIVAIGRRGIMIRYEGALFWTWVGASVEQNRGRWERLLDGMPRAGDVGASAGGLEPPAHSAAAPAGQFSR